MSAEIELIAESPEMPGCKNCGPRQEPVEPAGGEEEPQAPAEVQPTNGADIAVTLFLPGVGNGVQPSGRIDYVNPTDGTDHVEVFLQRLAAEFLAANPAAPCCRRILYRAHYHPFDSAYENAEELTKDLWSKLETLAGEPWVRKIYLHLLGHSAGGIVAINIAQEIEDEHECAIEAEDRVWCDVDMPAEVELSIDIVTMATPFGFRWFSLVDPPGLTQLVELFARAARFVAPVLGPVLRPIFRGYYEFLVSIGENDYGDEHPPCLCRFVSFVSPGDLDDQAGDRDPTQDDRLRDEDDPDEEWNPQPVRLAERLPGVRCTHDEVPETILAAPALSSALVPGCRCVDVP